MKKNAQSRRVPDKDRIRTSKACVPCRGRKVRCVLSPHGTCLRCETHQLACIFDEVNSSCLVSTEMGGRTPAVQHEQSNVPEQSITADDHVRVLSEFSQSPAESFFSNTKCAEDSAQRRDDGSTSDAQWAASNSGELEGAVLLVEDPDRTQYTGLRSNESFLLCIRDVLDMETNSTNVFKELEGTATPPRPQSRELLKALSEFPPQEIATFLVSTFFYYVEATFFYCDREWFLHTLKAVYNGSASAVMADESFVSFALLVFAFGSQFAHMRSNSGSQGPPITMIDPGRRFYEAAQTLVPRLLAKCTLKGIQVCLLAGLWNLPSNLPDTSYLYLGIAVRMSIASGLHRKTSTATLDARVIEVRNRLWWSVYNIDRRIAIALGRPASISEMDIDASYPKYLPALDDIEYQSNVQHQIEYTKLTRIVNKIMENIPLESKSITKEITAQLQQWRSQLFHNLDPNDVLPGGRNFRATSHLQVHYHWAWIRMGRASLLHRLKEHLQATAQAKVAKAPTSNSRQELAEHCVDAAKATIQLILVLKEHNLLCRYSFTDHQAPTAALVVLILDSILQPTIGPNNNRTIRDGIEMLSFMAHGGCRGAKADLQTVEQLRAFAIAVRLKLNTTEDNLPSAGVTLPGPKAAYESWVRWMAGRRSELGSDQSSSESGGATEAPSNSVLDSFYSHEHSVFDHDHLDVGSELHDGQALGFEWDGGRVDVIDMTQLLGSNMLYNPT